MKKRLMVFLVIALLFSAGFFPGAVPAASASGSTIMEFNNMAGVPRPFTGAANAIRGVPGGGLPWVVQMANGELKSNGKLEIRVVGLVLDPTDPTVIARGLGGTNPSPSFKAIVSCLTKDAAGAAVTVNVSTDPFPADASGNANIEDTVALPKPCLAPIVFVTSPTGSWFAVTGN